MSENNVTKKKSGKLAWLIPVLDFLVLIIYLVIGFGGLAMSAKSMDVGGMYNSVNAAIWFLIVAVIVITILCFIPVFKSKFNTGIAIFNILWLAWIIYSLF